MLFRRERTVAASLIMVIAGIVIGAGGSAFYAEKYGLFSLAVLALILEMSVVVSLFSYRLRKKIVGIGLTTIIVVGAALLIVYWPNWLYKLSDFVRDQAFGGH
jgi:hypothetical protein